MRKYNGKRINLDVPIKLAETEAYARKMFKITRQQLYLSALLEIPLDDPLKILELVEKHRITIGKLWEDVNDY